MDDELRCLKVALEEDFTDVLLNWLRKNAVEVLVHSTDDGWCVHLEHFWPEQGTQNSDLNQALFNACESVCKVREIAERRSQMQ